MVTKSSFPQTSRCKSRLFYYMEIKMLHKRYYFKDGTTETKLKWLEWFFEREEEKPANFILKELNKCWDNGYYEAPSIPELLNDLNKLDIWKEPEIEEGTFCRVKDNKGQTGYGYYYKKKPLMEFLDEDTDITFVVLEKSIIKIEPITEIPKYKGKK